LLLTIAGKGLQIYDNQRNGEFLAKMISVPPVFPEYYPEILQVLRNELQLNEDGTYRLWYSLIIPSNAEDWTSTYQGVYSGSLPQYPSDPEP